MYCVTSHDLRISRCTDLIIIIFIIFTIIFIVIDYIILYYRLNRVSAQPSTIMSWVAAKEFTQKNTDVSMVIWGVSSTNQSLIFDPMKKYDSPVPCNIHIV